MIIDTYENLKQYAKQLIEIDRIVAFIEENNESEKEQGKHCINGEDLYASVQQYVTKKQSEGRFEAHNNYIDLQYIVSGEEAIEVNERKLLRETTKYNPKDDIVFLDGEAKTRTILKSGDFAVFFSHEGHKPGLSTNKPSMVKKIVFKIRIE